MSGRGTIYYVGEFIFPEGRPMSSRVLGNSSALAAAGYYVHIVGRSGARSENTGELAQTAIKYSLIDFFGNREEPKWKQYWAFLSAGRKLTAWFRANIADDAKAIILYGGYTRFLAPLLLFASARKIPIIVDMADWIEPSHCWGGAFGPQRLDIDLTFKLFIPRAGHVITVSRFLADHFTKRCLHVICVPPLIDIRAPQWQILPMQLNNKGALRLAYVGYSGKKDLLSNIIRAIGLLEPKENSLKLDIVGPTNQDINRDLGADGYLLKKYQDVFSFKGKLPHNEALAVLKEADFTILARPDARYSRAGFPTKLVESLSMGIPVITNLTGDIGAYVCDGKEGIIAESENPQAIAGAITRALSLCPAEIAEMKNRSRKRAELSFDYRNWAHELGEFVDDCL